MNYPIVIGELIFVSVAWALRDCPDKPEVIMSWPGAGNRLWRLLIRFKNNLLIISNRDNT